MHARLGSCGLTEANFSGFLSEELVDDLIQECSKMSAFDHPNVLKLIGVCIDGGPAPYIIMPFLTNGSLLSYLKENRSSVVLDPQTIDPDDAVSACHGKLCQQTALAAWYSYLDHTHEMHYVFLMLGYLPIQMNK